MKEEDFPEEIKDLLNRTKYLLELISGIQGSEKRLFSNLKRQLSDQIKLVIHFWKVDITASFRLIDGRNCHTEKLRKIRQEILDNYYDIIYREHVKRKRYLK